MFKIRLKKPVLNSVARKIFVRRISQAASIFFFFFLFKRAAVFPVSDKLPLSIYFKMDGLLAVAMSIISKSFSLLFPAIFLLFLIMLSGNFFCSWLCPFGGIIDYICALSFRKYWKISPAIKGLFRSMRPWTLVFVLTSAVLAGFSYYPFLGFVFDPFVIMNGAFIGLKIWLVFFAVILMASILKPRLWCYCLCPLGWFYTLVGTKLRIRKIINFSREKVFKIR